MRSRLLSLGGLCMWKPRRGVVCQVLRTSEGPQEKEKPSNVLALLPTRSRGAVPGGRTRQSPGGRISNRDQYKFRKKGLVYPAASHLHEREWSCETGRPQMFKQSPGRVQSFNKERSERRAGKRSPAIQLAANAQTEGKGPGHAGREARWCVNKTDPCIYGRKKKKPEKKMH